MRLAAVFILCTGAALLPFAPVASAIGKGGWDHVGLGPSGTPSLNGVVRTLSTDLPGTLLVGGEFTSAGGNTAAARIASWNGTSWSALGPGILNGAVFAIASKDGRVYAGGSFMNAGGNANADHLAVWDGVAWGPFCNSGLGPAFTAKVGIATADMVAYFDGEVWRPIGSNGAGNGPIGTAVTALGVFEHKIYAGGAFTAAGGDAKARALAAYALRQPDARIGTARAGPWTGDAIYSPTAVGEAKTQIISRGSSGNFYVNVQNDGLVAAKFKLRGTGGATGYSATYFRASTDITTAVEAGSYSTGFIPPRGADTIRVRVELAGSTAPSASYLVEVTSLKGTPADAVKAIARPN